MSAFDDYADGLVIQVSFGFGTNYRAKCLRCGWTGESSGGVIPQRIQDSLYEHRLSHLTAMAGTPPEDEATT